MWWAWPPYRRATVPGSCISRACTSTGPSSPDSWLGHSSGSHACATAATCRTTSTASKGAWVFVPDINSPGMATYAHPDTLVETDWLAEHLDDAAIRVIEVDEDTTAYEKGHIRNAIGWNWFDDLHAK